MKVNKQKGIERLDIRQAFVKNIIYLVLFALAIISLFPFYTMLINATRASEDISSGISIFPGASLKFNMAKINANINLFQGLWNSLVVASSATFLSAYIGSMTAYGFYVFNFPFKKTLWRIILLMIMIPVQVLLIGIFEFANKFNLLDTYVMLILPAGAHAFSTFFLYQYMTTAVNMSLVQAARIDGASDLKIFHRIVIPLMLPGIATISIFNFVLNWNNYIIPLTVLYSQTKFTLPMLISLLSSTSYRADFGAIYLAVAISVLPVIIIFLFLSRYIISGLGTGGIKE